MLAESDSRQPGRVRSVLSFGVKLLAAGAVLGAVTVFLGPVAAALAVGATLWLALALLARQRRREREATEARMRRQRENYNSVIGVLASALGICDSVTAEQSRRVSELASAVAQEMSLGREQVALVQTAALLHDIGKTGISEQILSKPAALTESEWAEMKRHPEIGYDILRSTDRLRDAAEIVRAHHERFDGQGYPRRLSGEEIPIGSRIVAIVDAFVAMTSDRPFRRKMPRDMATKEVLRNALTQFDPEVVRAFMTVEERGLVAATNPAEAASNGAGPVVTSEV